MNRTTFVNLPARDLAKTTEFFTALGFAFDPNVDSADTRRMVISDAASIMWQSETYFAEFTGTAIADTATTHEVAVGVSAGSRAEVDELVEQAIAAGGRDGGMQDQGWMYMRAFLDLDGHRWSAIHLAG